MSQITKSFANILKRELIQLRNYCGTTEIFKWCQDRDIEIKHLQEEIKSLQKEKKQLEAKLFEFVVIFNKNK